MEKKKMSRAEQEWNMSDKELAEKYGFSETTARNIDILSSVFACVVVSLILWMGFKFVSFLTAPKTQAEIAAEAAEKAAADMKFAMRVDIAKGQDDVLKRLRDPDSVQWRAKYVNLKTSAICYSFRAKNGFGAYDDDGMVIVDNEITSSDKVWNKHCADGNGNTFEHFY